MIRAQTRKHPEVKSKYAQVPNKWLLDDVCFLPTCSEDLWTFAGIPASGPATILSCLSGCRQMCEAVVGMVAMPEKVEGGREEGWGGAEPRRDREGHSLVQNLGKAGATSLAGQLPHGGEAWHRLAVGDLGFCFWVNSRFSGLTHILCPMLFRTSIHAWWKPVIE